MAEGSHGDARPLVLERALETYTVHAVGKDGHPILRGCIGLTGCGHAMRRKDFMRQMNTSAYDESDDEDDGRPRGVQCAQQ